MSALGAGGDATTVAVEPGQIVPVTLRNRGVATIKGHLFDWRSGAPIAGERCRFGMRSGGGSPAWDTINSAVSDVEGRFTLEGVPAGAVTVECDTKNLFVIPGRASFTLTEGEVGSAEIPLLERSQRSAGLLGAELGPNESPIARIISVQPHGPADRAGLRAGDVITSVDGRPITNLMPYSVGALIVDRGAGGEARLGIVRNGATSSISLILGPPVVY